MPVMGLGGAKVARASTVETLAQSISAQRDSSESALKRSIAKSARAYGFSRIGRQRFRKSIQDRDLRLNVPVKTDEKPVDFRIARTFNANAARVLPQPQLY